MVHSCSFETYQTVPVVGMDEMTPYLRIEQGDGKSFPLPGEEFRFMRFDLSRALIRNPAHTYFVQISTNALQSAGYRKGDIAIVDRHDSPRHGQTILAYYEGDFTLLRLLMKEDETAVYNDEEEVVLEPDMDFAIWGVVKDVLHD
jgi:DNA polymerase V